MPARGEAIKAIIAGTRTIDDYTTVVNGIIASGWYQQITEVVCGDCEGVDQMGDIWAKSRGLPVKHFSVTKEEWRIYGKRAGPIRNECMALYAEPDGALILVWDGKSTGSASMKAYAEQYGLKIYQHLVAAQKEA